MEQGTVLQSRIAWSYDPLLPNYDPLSLLG